MRVVLDVNILVSAALTPTPGQQARDILDRAEDQYTLLLSDFILMKVSEILRLLQEDGWVIVATRGSHRQYKHPSKPGRVTVPGKPSDDLAPGTLNSILKQAGLKK